VIFLFVAMFSLSLLKFNLGLLSNLHERLSKWDERSTIGDIFISKVSTALWQPPHTKILTHTHLCPTERQNNEHILACMLTDTLHTHTHMHTPFHLSPPVWLLAMASNPPRTHHSPGHETLSNQLEALNFDQVGHAEAMGH